MLLSIHKVYTQDCDCAYPIIFVHGWGGSEETWLKFSEKLEYIWGDKIQIPQYNNGSYSDGTVYYANLNYEYGSNATNYITDVKLHDDFINAPTIKNSCVYAISFQVKRDPNFTDPVLITSSHPLYHLSETDVPNTDNYSNESAIFKQGYALGKAIEKILSITQKEKVILVGHSMGGLASREYLQRRTPGNSNGTPNWWVYPNEMDGHRVAKLFTAGTPHRGSNTGNWQDNPQTITLLGSTFGFDLMSESVRDLRISYEDSNNNEYPGTYLYGSNETENPNYPETFWNLDVDCDENFISDITALNDPSGNIGSGTISNPEIPLPSNTKYTYYVSNLDGLGTDGIVSSKRQWLYSGGNGSTFSFATQKSFPRPFLEKEYFLSDRLTAKKLHTSQTEDEEYLLKGIDEADFPFFAYKVSKGKWYAGSTQKRADIVASDSNGDIGFGTSDPETDSDWYEIEIDADLINGRLVLIRDNLSTATKIELFDSSVDLNNNNQTNTPLFESWSPEKGIKILTLNLEDLQSGTYYFRITQSVKKNNNAAHQYKFIIADETNQATITAKLKYDETKTLKVLEADNNYYLADIYNSIYVFDMNYTDDFGNAGLEYAPVGYWANNNILDIHTDAYWATQSVKDIANNEFTDLNLGLEYVDSVLVFSNTKLTPDRSNANAYASYDYQSIVTGIGNKEKGIKPVSSIDVMSHEFFHLINTKNDILTDQYDENDASTFDHLETNGLREGFSDIFGVYMEHLIGNNNQVSNGIYKLGTDVNIIKDFKYPQKYDPKAQVFYNNNLTGGPHSVGALLYHWFYILSEGKADTYNGRKFNVEGISIEKAFKIAMQTFSSKLDQSSKFQDVYTGSLEIAQDEFGFCSPEYNAVLNAWYAIGVANESGLMIDDLELTESACTQGTGTATLTMTNSNLNYYYNWDNGSVTATAIDLSTGSHAVTISTDTGCQLIKSFEIEQALSFEAEVKVEPNNNCNSPNGSALLKIKDKNTQATPVNIELEWKDQNQNVIGQSISVQNMIEGEYILHILDLDTECEEEINFEIEKKEAQIEIIGGGYRPICQDYIPDALILRPYVEDCNNCQVLDWSTVDGEIISESDEIEVPVANATYELIMVDEYGCLFLATTTIEIDFRDCEECDDGTLSFIDFTGVDPCKEFEIRVFAPRDPNEIISPLGYSDSRWVSNTEGLPYTILFENDPELAEASATRIEISHFLDSDINPASFRIGNFNFANLNFVVDGNNSFYQNRLDVRDSLGVFVDVVAGINVTENKAFWIFQAIDPATGLPPNDPDLGMLPVNDTITRNGEGSVQFKVKAKNTTETLDTIFATAEILFDENEVIITNTEFNTIDAFAPTSVLDSLPDIIDADTLTLSWSAEDDIDGCGIQDYSIYVSYNNEPFYLYASEISDTFYQFTNETNGLYCFQIKARDWVGNIEEKNIADACIEIGSEIEVITKVLLQGPYNQTDSLMSDSLRVGNLLPIASPYTDPILYPYTDLEANINNSIYNTVGPDAIVDWIYVELRDISSGQSIDGGSYLLQRDGDIINVESNTPIKFIDVPPGNYELTLFHRNHLPIKTNGSISIVPNILYNVDLSNDIDQVQGGLNAMRDIGGNLLMISGDLDLNGQIQNKDYLLLLNEIGTSGYTKFDLDFNGEVDKNDIDNYLTPNIGKGKQFD